MVRVPDWAMEAAGQEMRGMGQDAAMYHPGLYLTTAQVIYTTLLLNYACRSYCSIGAILARFFTKV